MSRICIGIISGNGVHKKSKRYADMINSFCQKHKRYLFFQDPADKLQPFFQDLDSLFSEYLYFSIADNKQFNNIEDMFTTCTDEGECWTAFMDHITNFQNLVSDIRTSIEETEGLTFFIGNSGCLLEDFDEYNLHSSEIYRTIYYKAKARGYWDEDMILNIET